MSALASRSVARARDADGVVVERALVRHLSETACVDAHSCLIWGMCKVVDESVFERLQPKNGLKLRKK